MSEPLTNLPEDQLQPFRLKQFAPKERVLGMIGFSRSGKSVFCSVFTHTLAYLPRAQDTGYSVEEGAEYVGETMDWLLNKRRFPPLTQPGRIRTIKIKLRKKGLLREKRILLHVNDVQGEPFDRLARGEIDDPKYFLLTHLKGEREKIGPYAFVLYAKAFALTIDCEEYPSWNTRQWNYVKLLQVLVEGKGKDRLREPLALVFTKCDMLPEDKQATGGSNLLADLPAVRDYVKEHFDPTKVHCVASQIGIERTADGRPKLDQKGNHIPRVRLGPSPSLEVSDKEFSDFVLWAFKHL